MNDHFAWLKRLVDRQNEKKYLSNCKKYERLKSMSEQELMFEYINVKVNYRHQKNIWILSIVLSVLLILQKCKSFSY